MKGILAKSFVLMVALGATGVVHARRVLVVKSEKRFDYMISKHSLAVVYFYNEPKAKRGKNRCVGQTALDRAVGVLASSRSYRDGGLFFLKVNACRADLANIMRDYNVTTMPTFMLFKNGTPLRGKDRKPVTLSGFVDGATLQDFIDAYLADDINARIEQKAIDRARREAARFYYWNYWGPGYGYYSGYPYGRLGFGFTI